MIKRVFAIIAALLIALSALTGCTTKICAFPGCGRDAAMFKDYCETHQKTADVFEGITGIFK